MPKSSRVLPPSFIILIEYCTMELTRNLSKYFHTKVPISLNLPSLAYPGTYTSRQLIPLILGNPDSPLPVSTSGCKHCLPVLYFPAHCELSFHLQSWVPAGLKFCLPCEKFTAPERHDVRECGSCGTSYNRRFERGRRMLDMRKGIEYSQERHRKWYNRNMQTDGP